MNSLFNSDVSIDQFLAEYWQRKPLLLRAAFPDIDNPVTPDELAGFACEDDSNARLILQDCGPRPWSVEYGPFDEDRFNSLPASGWSLLVSDMERHVAAVKRMQLQFDFLPDWRFDDVMISYAPEGGSVGAHVDKYDVFLLQTSGQRRWMIAESFDPECLADTDLEILKHFEAQQDWILEAGDMLYLPPGVAHHGLAVGDDCMTCSIGFRTPASDQLASEFIEQRCDDTGGELYSDAGMRRQQHPAEITPEALRQLRDMIARITDFDDTSLMRWFGRYMSERSSSEHVGGELVENDVPVTENTSMLDHNPAIRMLFSADGDHAVLFVDGHSHDVSLKFARTVCAHGGIERSRLEQSCSAEDKPVLADLLDKGYLVSSDD